MVQKKVQSIFYPMPKQTHVEPMSETVRQFFFQPEKKIASTKPPSQSQTWADICCTLNFLAKILEYSCRLYIWQFFSHLIVNDNNCTRRFTRHILFDANLHTLVKPCGCFFSFFINEKIVSPKCSLLTQIRFYICRTLHPPPIRNSVCGWTEFCKIMMTLGRRNLHSPTHRPLGTNFFLFPAFRCH